MAFGRSIFLSVSILVSAAFPAGSQPPPAAAPTGMTLDRFLDQQTNRIMAADTDGDGRVSRAEMSAMPTKGGRDPSRLFDAMDANHDGYLDKAEIQSALTRRFRRMDSNGDGVITPDERMARRMRSDKTDRAETTAAPQP